MLTLLTSLHFHHQLPQFGQLRNVLICVSPKLIA